MFAHTSLKQSFASSNPTSAYTGGLSRFLWDEATNTFNHPNKVFKLLLADYLEWHENNPTNNYGYYFWVRNLIKDFNALSVTNNIESHEVRDVIVHHINLLKEIDKPLESVFGKLVRVFIQNNPDVYIEIEVGLRQKLNITSPFGVQTDEYFANFIRNMSVTKESAKLFRKKQFHLIKHYLDESKLKSLYEKAVIYSDVEMMIETLRLYPNYEFNIIIRRFLNESHPFLEHDFKLNIINECLPWFDKDSIIEAYKFFIKEFDTNIENINVKISLLIKFQYAFPDLIDAYLSVPEKKNHLVRCTVLYCSTYVDINQAVDDINVISRFTDNLYSKISSEFVSSPKYDDKRLKFISLKSDLMPEQSRAMILHNLIDGVKKHYVSFEKILECVRRLYSPLCVDKKKEFKNYFFNILNELDGNSLCSDIFILLGNFITYFEPYEDGLEIFKYYWNKLNGYQSESNHLLEGFMLTEFDFLPQCELANLAEYLLPYLTNKNCAYHLSQIFKMLYLKMQPSEKSHFQQSLLAYLKMIVDKEDDKEFIRGLCNLSSLLGVFRRPLIFSIDLIDNIKKSIGRVLAIIPVLQTEHNDFGGFPQGDLGRANHVNEHLWFATLTLNRLDYFVDQTQYNNHIELLSVYIKLKIYPNHLRRFYDYHKLHYKTLDAHHQNSFFKTFFNALDIYNGKFSGYFTYDRARITDLFAMCKNPDNSLNYSRAKIIIDKFIDMDSEPLSIFLGLLDDAPQKEFSYYAFLKLSERCDLPLSTEKHYHTRNMIIMLAANLHSIHYVEIITSSLNPILGIKELCSGVLNYL